MYISATRPTLKIVRVAFGFLNTICITRVTFAKESMHFILETSLIRSSSKFLQRLKCLHAYYKNQQKDIRRTHNYASRRAKASKRCEDSAEE